MTTELFLSFFFFFWLPLFSLSKGPASSLPCPGGELDSFFRVSIFELPTGVSQTPLVISPRPLKWSSLAAALATDGRGDQPKKGLHCAMEQPIAQMYCSFKASLACEKTPVPRGNNLCKSARPAPRLSELSSAVILKGPRLAFEAIQTRAEGGADYARNEHPG